MAAAVDRGALRARVAGAAVHYPSRELAGKWSLVARAEDAIGAILGDVDPPEPVLPVLRCGSCGSPVRWATEVEAVWSRKYGGWPDPVRECAFCGPGGQARAGRSW